MHCYCEFRRLHVLNKTNENEKENEKGDNNGNGNDNDSGKGSFLPRIIWFLNQKKQKCSS